MFKCAVCGSIGQSSGRCGICGGAVDEIPKEHRVSTAVLTVPRSKRLSRRFWIRTRYMVLIVLVLVAISSAGAATYLSVRSASPSCKNYAVNYPSCNTCGSWGSYNSIISQCQCNNGFINPPSCDRACGNGAINGAVNSPKGEIGCDRCPDGRTTDYGAPCRPYLPIDIQRPASNYRTNSST